MTKNKNHSPGTASQAVLNEIASWTPEQLDQMVTAAFEKAAPTEMTTCVVRGCGAEFYLIESRGDRKHLCLTHSDAYMRANGHQNDPAYSVD